MATAQDITAASKTGANDDNVIFGAEQTEVERLDLQHRCIHDANPQFVYAPLDLSKGGYRILDQATGSGKPTIPFLSHDPHFVVFNFLQCAIADNVVAGIWIRDAREAAGADNEWVGTDIEAQWFPKEMPADTTYQRQSMTEPWPQEWIESFDLVHSRMALPGVGVTPLENAVKNLIGLVKPGGWIQLVEMEWNDWKMGPEGTILRNAIKELFTTVSAGQGVDLREKLIPMFKEAGLENIDYTIIKTPFGAHASDKIRSASEASLFATAMGVSMTTKMLPPISIPREQLDAMPQKALDEAKKEGWECQQFVLWAQKPLKQ